MDRSPPRELEALADTLWAERHLVELLLYRLTLAKLVLAADERRFVALAVGEVDEAVNRLREAELRRELAIAELADAWGEPASELTLTAVAERAPQPWSKVFTDHREGFRALTEEIEATSAENRRLASAGLQSVQHALDVLTTDRTGTYTAAGVAEPSSARPTRLDQTL